MQLWQRAKRNSHDIHYVCTCMYRMIRLFQCTVCFLSMGSGCNLYVGILNVFNICISYICIIKPAYRPTLMYIVNVTMPTTPGAFTVAYAYHEGDLRVYMYSELTSSQVQWKKTTKKV